MPFGWMAGASVLGSIFGGSAAKKAANTQADASRYAADVQRGMFDTINRQQEPYRQAGYTALGDILNRFGVSQQNSTMAPMAPDHAKFYGPSTLAWDSKNLREITVPGTFDEKGYNDALAKYNSDLSAFNSSQPQGLSADDPNSFLHVFNANDLNSNLAPNWQFALNQGQGAVQNLANKAGGLVSGNSLRGIADYTLGKSGDLYQQAFQNYTANQSNIFNRLSAIAGLGQTANQATATSAGTFGTNIGNAIQNAGAAQAGGQIGAANALMGGMNNAMGWYGLSKFLG